MSTTTREFTAPTQYRWRDFATPRAEEGVLHSFGQMLEMHLPYMAGRSARMDRACWMLGLELNLDSQSLFSLSLAARFHDIGLLGVPTDILLKEGRLTPEEMARMYQHTDIGGRLVAKSFPDFPDAVEGIWFHHERCDGKGPHGLKEAEIPVIGGIISLASGIEAMANDRPYRPAMSLPVILDELSNNAKGQFSPRLVSIFTEMAGQIYPALVVPGNPATPTAPATN